MITPGARVVASDIDERAVACAAANGVEVYRGDLFAPLPSGLAGRVDVVVGVVPYVPTSALPLLQRDTFAFESTLSYDGGLDGTDILPGGEVSHSTPSLVGVVSAPAETAFVEAAYRVFNLWAVLDWTRSG